MHHHIQHTQAWVTAYYHHWSPQKTVSKQRFQLRSSLFLNEKKRGVTGSPPIFCKVIRSALALKRTASAAAPCVNCSSSWGRPMGDPSACKGASPPCGRGQKNTAPSTVTFVVGIGWVMLSGSQWFTFEMALKMSLTVFMCCNLEMIFSVFQLFSQ